MTKHVQPEPILTPTAIAIRDTARAIIDRVGFEALTIDEVARLAGVNEVTVYRIFGTRNILATACWQTNLATMETGIRRDRSRIRDPLERIASHLRRLARIAATDRALTHAMINAVEASTVDSENTMGELDPRLVVPLVSLCTPLIASAQEAGAVRKDHQASEIAAFLTNGLLLRFLTRPDETPAAIASFVVDMTLDGIRQR